MVTRMAEDQAPPGNINVHTQSVSIQPVPEFNPDSEVGASLATKWQTWVDYFEMFLTASGIKDKKKKKRFTPISSWVAST